MKYWCAAASPTQRAAPHIVKRDSRLHGDTLSRNPLTGLPRTGLLRQRSATHLGLSEKPNAATLGDTDGGNALRLLVAVTAGHMVTEGW